MTARAAVPALIGALLLAPLAARATDWTVAPERSSVGFDYAVNGSPGEASFARFEGGGAFDPARPEESELRLVIDIRSLWAGDPLTTSFMLHEDWFDAEGHPEAVFELTSMEEISAEGPERFYRAAGRLEIKGVTREIRATLSLGLDGETARAVGASVFDPADFGITGGASALLAKLDPVVRVSFDIVAERAEEEGATR